MVQDARHRRQRRVFLSLPVASKASQRAGWLAAAAADGEVCVLQVPL